MHLEKYPDWGVWDTASRKRVSSCLGILVDIFVLIFDPVSTKYFSKIVSKNIKGRVTYRFSCAMLHNDAGGWGGGRAITNDALKFRKIMNCHRLSMNCVFVY